ncbi:MAG: hypothetical protein DIU68_005470 [Chloroflexota bacterium]
MLTAQATDSVTAGVRLQQSRRLDWRFLLPDPRLGAIGYFGPQDETLLAALREFSSSVEALDWEHEREAAFDGVVVKQPASARLLAQAAQAVRPGGFLYVELRRKPRQALVGHSRTYRAALIRAGFEEPEYHWHWPDFERCTRFVPLNVPGPLMFDLSNGARGPRRFFFSAAARVAVASGLLARVVPCISLIATRVGR